MRKILICFFCAISLIARAQDVYSYYSSINKGRQFLIEGDLSAALNSYHTAFDSYDKPFARDCYNAVELSVSSGDTTHLEYFLRKAVSRGITLKSIESSGLVNEYLDTRFYNKLKKEEVAILDLYASNINWKLREEINQMFSEDQLVREEYYKANLFKRKRIRKRWESLNAQQVTRLIEITKLFGFPGENLIGLDRNDMHPKISTTNYSAGMPIVIFIHHFSQPNASYDELLVNEVEKGNLYNEHFATICDFEAEFGNNEFNSSGYYGLRQLPRKYNATYLNLKRQKIGVLEIGQLEKLNKVKNITKFWNRLY